MDDKKKEWMKTLLVLVVLGVAALAGILSTFS